METPDDYILFTRLHTNAIIPWKSTLGSIGYNLFSPIDVKIHSHEIMKIPLDIAMKLPKNYFGIIVAGNSEQKLNIIPLCIDSDYHENIEIIVQNTNRNASITIVKHTKIAQIIIVHL